MNKLLLLILPSLLYSQALPQLLTQVPEMVPYRLLPCDYSPNAFLELEIEIIAPITTDGFPAVHKAETLEIFYERINFEVVNPERRNEMFKIDGKLYYLIRLPFNGVPWQ
jgi:hypothetical protein